MWQQQALLWPPWETWKVRFPKGCECQQEAMPPSPASCREDPKSPQEANTGSGVWPQFP